MNRLYKTLALAMILMCVSCTSDFSFKGKDGKEKSFKFVKGEFTIDEAVNLCEQRFGESWGMLYFGAFGNDDDIETFSKYCEKSGFKGDVFLHTYEDGVKSYGCSNGVFGNEIDARKKYSLLCQNLTGNKQVTKPASDGTEIGLLTKIKELFSDEKPIKVTINTFSKKYNDPNACNRRDLFAKELKNVKASKNKNNGTITITFDYPAQGWINDRGYTDPRFLIISAFDKNEINLHEKGGVPTKQAFQPEFYRSAFEAARMSYKKDIEYVFLKPTNNKVVVPVGGAIVEHVERVNLRLDYPDDYYVFCGLWGAKKN